MRFGCRCMSVMAAPSPPILLGLDHAAVGVGNPDDLLLDQSQ